MGNEEGVGNRGREGGREGEREGGREGRGGEGRGGRGGERGREGGREGKAWGDFYLHIALQYDGDTERTLPRPSGERPEVPFNLRATVDGDARRGRRQSSDESAIGTLSDKDMDHSEYLKGYQSSTPMQPGRLITIFTSSWLGTAE